MKSESFTFSNTGLPSDRAALLFEEPTTWSCTLTAGIKEKACAAIDSENSVPGLTREELEALSRYDMRLYMDILSQYTASKKGGGDRWKSENPGRSR